ncbi:MAG TPA: peptide chain release factor 2 [Vicinamibacterales bacterium]|nr:peptide chain release factor 2 [Vicinamibacterales bacterium]
MAFDLDDSERRYDDLKRRAAELRRHLEAARLDEQLADIEKHIGEPNFWSNQAEAQKVMQRRRRVDDELTLLKSLKRRGDDLGVLFEWAKGGEDVGADLQRGLDEFQQEIDTAESKKMLSGEHDQSNAIVTIHPGAGGTESQDWAEMLLRMYLKWSERKGFRRELMDYQPGEEAGIKSATVLFMGEAAFGFLSAEAGVHRLVRISPFDQAARRHTSFASVFVWPELPEDVDVEIDDKDLRVDTFRSSGAGGQHVNVTDSAIRITHIPTGIVVSCQNERSQLQNRETAMRILKARLLEKRVLEQEAEQARERGEMRSADWGSQIRSYVLHPYTLVKDHRTGVEVGDPTRVLDGDIDSFIEAALSRPNGGGTASA